MMVRIGGDPSGLETAFKKADGLIQQNSEKFKKAGRAMTVAGAAIVGSLGLMVKGYVKAGDEVHKMALRTSFSTEALSELKYAAEISGASLSDVEKGVKKMSKTIVDAEDGLATYVRAFERIGLTSEELMALSPEEQFDKISQAIARVENPTIRAAAAQDIFGRAGTKLLPLFAEGEKGLEALRAKAREMGIVFDQEAADKAAKLNDSITTLKGSMQGVGISIASTLVPVITELTDKLSAIAIKVKDWTKEHPGLTKAIIKAVAAAGALMTVFGPLLIILPHLAAGFKTLKIAITALTGPLGIVTGGLIFLAARAYAAGDAFKSMSEALDEHAKVSGEKMGAIKKAWYGVEAAYHKVFVGYDIGKVRTKALAEETAKLRAEQAAYGQVVLDSISGTKIYADAMTALEGGVVNAALGFLGLKIGTEETGKASKDWAAVLKGEGVQSIEDYKKEINDLKDKKKLLKEALDAGAISLQTYRSEVESVNSKLETLRGTTKAAKEEYIDFSKVIGEKTIPAMITLDAQLAALWGQLQSGAITWDEWADRSIELKERARKLAEGIGGIGMAMEDNEIIFEEAGDVIGNILKGIKINTTGLSEDILKSFKTTAEGIKIRFKSAIEHIIDLTRDLASGFSNIFVDLLNITGNITYQMKEFDDNYWGDALANAQNAYEEKKQWILDNVADEEEKNAMLLALEKNHETDKAAIRADEDIARDAHAEREEKRQNSLWNKIKTVFGEAVESMITAWMTDFVQKMLLSITSQLLPAAASVATSMGGIGAAMTGIGTGLATLITSLAIAIATAATTLAAAAPAILVVAAMALAIYAGFKILGSIFGKKGGAQAGVERILNLIWEEARNCLNNLDNMKWILEDVKQTLWRLADNLIPILDDIKHAAWAIADAIGNITSAQTGFHGMVSKPTAIIVHPGEPIDIGPLGKMGAAQPITKIIYENHFHINALDSQSFEDALKRGPGSKIVKLIQGEIDRTNIRIPITAVGR